jgi:hypothetical protein
MVGIADVGVSPDFSREGHVHPTDTTKVNSAGDTMTESLTISNVWPILYLDRPSGTNSRFIIGQSNDSNRWSIIPEDNTLETGSDSGSDFTINRYVDDCTGVTAPILTIFRSTGDVVVDRDQTQTLGHQTRR